MKTKYNIGDKIIMEIKGIDEDTRQYFIGFPGYDNESRPNYIIGESQLPLLQVLSKRGVEEARTYTKKELGESIRILTNYIWNVPLGGDMGSAVRIALKVMLEELEHIRGPLFQFLTEGSLQNTTGNKIDHVKKE